MAASAFSQVQVPKPKNWQDFEQGSSILWRQILNDDGLNRFGRGGQEQHGMDMFGYRNGDPGRIVGVQCKCNSHNKMPSEDDFRKDFEKALKWEPKLTEYFFTYTADDDGPLQTFAAKLTEEQRKLNRKIIVRAWGWGTIEQRLAEHDCVEVFDPNHSAVSKRLEQNHQEVMAGINALQAIASQPKILSTDDTTAVASAAEAQLDLEIDRYRDLMKSGHPKSALKLLKTLQSSLTDSNSGHVWFRVEANIAHCYLHMGNEEKAAELLAHAVTHAADDPKASANLVLSLILKGENQAALDLALRELAKDGTSEVLAAYAVQAAGNLGQDDPLSLIPPGLRGTHDVQYFHLTNLRTHEGLGWVEVARDAVEKWPDDETFKRHLAEGEIETVLMGQHAQTWRLQPAERDVLKKATDELIAFWDKARQQEVPERQDNLALCMNAAIGLLLQRDPDGAKKLIEQGLAVAGDNHDLLIRAAALAFESGDREAAKSLFPRLPSDGFGLLLRVQIAGRDGDWKYIASLRGSESLDTLPATEVETVNALIDSAHVNLKAKRDPAGAEKALVAHIAKACEARPLVLLAQMADDLGFDHVAKSAYDRALASITADSHISSRQMVATYASRRRDHEAVINLLDGFVDLASPSDELDELSAAFAYQYPPKARGLGFFKELPDEMRETERMAVLEGILHIHRQDIPSAEERFAAAVRVAPTKLHPFLMLAQVLLRQKKQPQVLDMIREIDPKQMNGTPHDRMHFAHLLGMAGRYSEAFEIGYEVLDENKNDPTVNLKWIGLGLTHLPHLAAMSNSPVDVGMWVRLTSEDGQLNEFTIVDGPNRPADGRYARDHSLAGASIGHRAGDKFTLTDGIGRERVWTVEQVRHRYHHAYEDTVEHFNDRFPNENGFWVVKTQGDDIQPLLDMVRRQGERAERILGLYNDKTVPLSFIVEIAGGSVITFAETLRVQGIDIDTCDNTELERTRAMSAIRKFKGRGAVLDTLTHWTLVGLDAVDVLQSVFGRLLVARSTQDDVLQLSEDDGRFEGTERSGTAFFHNGQFHFDEMTPEREKAREEALRKRENSFGAHFEVMPVHAPDDLQSDLVDYVNRGALDPIFLAREHDMLLVSDDRRYRVLGKSMGVEGAWLQAVFFFARHNGVLSQDRYATLTADLAALRHTSMTFGASDVARLVALTTPETKYRLHAIASCLGNKNAGMASHIRVLRESIEELWDSGPTLDGKYATGLLIQNAIRYRPEYRAKILRVAEGALSRYYGGQEYFENWKVGHFFSRSVEVPETLSFALSEPNESRGKKRSRRARMDWRRSNRPTKPYRT